MLWAIASFEFRRRTRLLSTWIYFILFFALSFLFALTLAGFFASVPILQLLAGGKIPSNAPFVLYVIITGIGQYSLLLMSIMGQAVYQDFHTNAYATFFTLPISKFQYLGGRFLGAMLTMVLILSSAALACMIAYAMPFIDKTTLGPFSAAAYVLPYLINVIPNVLFMGALFFGLAALTRKMTPVYAGMIILFIGRMIADQLVAKLENKFFAGLLDPFGSMAFGHLIEYWSVAEKGTRLITFNKEVLLNRLIWLSVGGAALAFTYYRFRFEQGGDRGRRVLETAPSAAEKTVAMPVSLPIQPPNPFLLLPRLTWLNFRETVKNPFFAVIALAGVLFIFSSSTTMGSIYGTTTYPVTYEVLDHTMNAYGLFLLIIVTLFSGELVWRERDAGMDQISDAMPVPGWLPFTSKFLALCLMQAMLLSIVMVCGVLIQACKGYFNFELGIYVKELFGMRLFTWVLLCVLSLTVQVIVNNKYVGHFVMVLYYLGTAFMGQFGFEHHLYQYASSPGYQYSDMNGFGHFLQPVFWFDLYWGAFAVLLAIASNLLWVRGLDTHVKKRLALARARFTRPWQGMAALSGATFLAAGGFIFYNTNVLNEYRTRYEGECLQADYEKEYKHIQKMAHPRIVSTKVRFEIYPELRRLDATGSYELKNKTNEPISTVYLTVGSTIEIKHLSIGTVTTPSVVDKRMGIQKFDLPAPMKPGDSLPLEFDLRFEPHGFKNEGSDTLVVYNGTFFNSSCLPEMGYSAGFELYDDATRKKHGLEPKVHMAEAHDLPARMNNYISDSGDWIDLDATVGTSSDQIAIAPGYLQREWEENGRHYFQYKTTNRILDFFSVLSARYEIKRDTWNGIPLEIYYHKGHEYNLERMMKGMQLSLDYCTKNYSPYQHKQMRIIEFPRTDGTFAQSFPNTIPYSESIGFIAKVDPSSEEDIDYPVYVTAHEVSHQWWAHQVIGGNVQGATMLSETLAQYTALMVMKKEFGPEKMKRFLHYELNQYLMSRGVEHWHEMPLCQNENQQYIHYNKGSLAMYALQDYIGEENVNRALSNFLKAVAFQEPPYTNSYELLAEFRKVTPPEMQSIIEDLFETITLYENRAVTATYKKTADGKFEVHLKVEAKKFRIDDKGEEKEIPINDLVDIGVLDAGGKPLYLKKEWIRQTECEFTITVDSLPIKAGIDPINKLIDRKPDDNVMAVTGE